MTCKMIKHLFSNQISVVGTEMLLMFMKKKLEKDP